MAGACQEGMVRKRISDRKQYVPMHESMREKACCDLGGVGSLVCLEQRLLGGKQWSLKLKGNQESDGEGSYEISSVIKPNFKYVGTKLRQVKQFAQVRLPARELLLFHCITCPPTLGQLWGSLPWMSVFDKVN